MASSIVCPTPHGHSGLDAQNMYAKKKQEMPGLTPAAWRKAAAQEMGLDYPTYLQLWKDGATAKKALKLVPESTPTLEAVVSPGPEMGIKLAKPKTPTQEFHAQLDGLKKAHLDGELDASDVIDILNDLQHEFVGVLEQDYMKIQINSVKIQIEQATKAAYADKFPLTTAAEELKAKAIADAAKAADEFVQTHLGPMNHDLAQSVYKKMKKDLPGATPATLRHAAADYLQVSYDDYLAAWKKPGLTKIKNAALPPNTTIPMSPSSAGKYAKYNISNDEVKQELARLYGPGANPSYIVATFDSTTGEYTVILPKGLLDASAQQKVVQGLKDLGLEVKQTTKGTGFLGNSETLTKIKSPQYKPPPPPAPLSATNAYNVTKLGDGTTVLDTLSGDEWTRRWWRTISENARSGVREYTTSSYRTINSALRKGRALTGNMKALSQAMPTTDKAFTVFRGCGDEAGRSLTIDAFKAGDLFTDQGFMSTAVNQGAAWRGVHLVIDLPKGSKGMYIDSVSSARGELEFLIDANTQFRVVSVQPGHSKYSGTVHLVAIPK